VVAAPFPGHDILHARQTVTTAAIKRAETGPDTAREAPPPVMVLPQVGPRRAVPADTSHDPVLSLPEAAPVPPSAPPQTLPPAPGQMGPDRAAPDPARLMQQVVDAARAGHSAEVRLDPAELGQMRLQVTATDDQVSIMLTAERAETADLFRRHANELAQDLRALGYANVSFSFGQGSGAGQSSTPERHLAAGAAPGSESDAPNSPPAVRPSAGGLDLRL
jgi:flagellar hook-length control protein FliK